MSRATKEDKILILGAGVAGLSAGWKLAERGKSVHILDLEGHVGGLCRTIWRGDFGFDLGGHRFFTQDAALEEEIHSLMEDALSSCSRISTILLGGKYYKYPLDLLDLVQKAGPKFMVSAFATYLASNLQRAVRPTPERTFEDWVKGRFGKTLYDIYFAVYTRKLWGLDPSQISSDWAVQRISLINLWDVLYRLVLGKSNTPRTYAVEFLFPSDGIGVIPDRISEKVCDAGGEVTLGARVVGVERREPGAITVEYEKDGKRRSIDGTRLIVTTPLPEFIRMVRPSPPAPLLEKASGLKYRSIRFLYLCIDRERMSDNTWIYIPEEDFLFFRIQEPKNWSLDLAPPGKTSLILEIACDEGDAVWTASDKTLFDRALPELARLGLGVKEGEVLDYFSVREKHAYPIYHLGYRQDVDAVRAYFDAMEDIILCGRQGIYRYNNMDHSIQMGFYAAKFLLGELTKGEIYGIAEGESSFESRA